MRRLFWLKAIILSGLLIIGFPVNAYAAEESNSINYVAQYQSKNISGIEISLVKVADIDGHVYAPYNSVVKELTNVDTGTAISYASDMAKHFDTSSSKAVKAKTNSYGYASFTDLSDGIYLALQTGSSEQAVNYHNMQPALLSLPEVEGGSVNHAITAYVKTEPVTVPEKPTNPTPQKVKKPKKTKSKTSKGKDKKKNQKNSKTKTSTSSSSSGNGGNGNKNVGKNGGISTSSGSAGDSKYRNKNNPNAQASDASINGNKMNNPGGPSVTNGTDNNGTANGGAHGSVHGNSPASLLSKRGVKTGDVTTIKVYALLFGASIILLSIISLIHRKHLSHES